MQPIIYFLAALPVVLSAPEELPNHRPHPAHSKNKNKTFQISFADNESSNKTNPFLSLLFPSLNFPNSNHHPSIWNSDDLLLSAFRALQEAESLEKSKEAETKYSKKSSRDRKKKKKQKKPKGPKPEAFEDSTSSNVTQGVIPPTNGSDFVENRPHVHAFSTLYMVMVKATENETIIDRVVIEKIHTNPILTSPKTQTQEPMEKIVAQSIECIRNFESGKEQTPEEAFRCPMVVYSSAPYQVQKVEESVEAEEKTEEKTEEEKTEEKPEMENTEENEISNSQGNEEI